MGIPTVSIVSSMLQRAIPDRLASQSSSNERDRVTASSDKRHGLRLVLGDVVVLSR